MLHDRMSDLVYVKFNSRLKHRRENKAREPIEKQVLDILEDDDNGFHILHVFLHQLLVFSMFFFIKTLSVIMPLKLHSC